MIDPATTPTLPKTEVVIIGRFVAIERNRRTRASRRAFTGTW
jgi:hypothetical protein